MAMTDSIRIPNGNGLRRASPLRGIPDIRERGDNRWSSNYLVDDTEPVLAGHFPGFAIFPGICLIECANLTALAALADIGGRGQPRRLAAVESARFLRPVFPGDEVRAEVTLSQQPAGAWICSARLSVRGADAAAFRLRYQSEG
jgi:3-hydroxyacyl-[acyl-carrier-protein] dehydratase